MKLKQLEFLVSLKQNLSFSKVAAEMHMSQPAISLSIKELEQELGYPVLRRTNRGVEFTERGLEVVKQAELILNSVDNIQKLGGRGDGFACVLRLGALPHICNTIALNAQLELGQLYPELTLDIVWDETRSLMAGVESGDLDLAIVHVRELDEELLDTRIKEKKLRYGRLYTDRVYFAVADNHPLLGLETVTLEDLLPYPYLQFRNCMSNQLVEFGKQYDYPRKTIKLDDMTGMRKQMPLLNSVAVMPELSIKHGNDCFLVQFIPLNVAGADWTTEVGWLHGPAPLTQSEQAVIDVFLKHCP